VAINDVLPLKAARLDAIANLKFFGAPGHQRLNFMVSLTFTMRRHLILLESYHNVYGGCVKIPVLLIIFIHHKLNMVAVKQKYNK